MRSAQAAPWLSADSTRARGCCSYTSRPRRADERAPDVAPTRALRDAPAARAPAPRLRARPGVVDAHPEFAIQSPIRAGDTVSIPDQPVTVATEGTSSTALSLIVDL